MNSGGWKKCSACQEILPASAFARNGSRPDGLQANCRECAAEYYRRRQEARGRTVREKVDVPDGHKLCRMCGEIKPHSEWHRNATASDGLSTRCRACRGLCVICLKAPAVHVDHCHKTGKVRGVLCFNCNSAIGKLGDDPDAVRRAAAYLEGTSWKPTLVAPGVYQLPS
ncbi:endonuclease VII domain-containing protein [Streptomyces sp. 15-116A]|uniref:endonuclease VII domain-containing protein n=1 Tax=Streptomyces sp. 15-116A TaxID=2259035 RepID=UPI0021B28A8A|nr:endonuclease VII domain-containing protein [Streptomyces sp. 15-116A]MCT7352744.1 endonuclease VII domain-containing protein [Streptomyces sp. 15-116A]